MTTTEFGIILATIWIAPHAPQGWGLITGIVILGVVVAHQTGYL